MQGAWPFTAHPPKQFIHKSSPQKLAFLSMFSAKNWHTDDIYCHNLVTEQIDVYYMHQKELHICNKKESIILQIQRKIPLFYAPLRKVNQGVLTCSCCCRSWSIPAMVNLHSLFSPGKPWLSACASVSMQGSHFYSFINHRVCLCY